MNQEPYTMRLCPGTNIVCQVLGGCGSGCHMRRQQQLDSAPLQPSPNTKLMIVEAAFEAGFKDCREKVEEILCRAMSWPVPRKLTNPSARRRYIVSEIQSELERLKP